jgi:hypothetical protein
MAESAKSFLQKIRIAQSLGEYDERLIPGVYETKVLDIIVNNLDNLKAAANEACAAEDKSGWCAEIDVVKAKALQRKADITAGKIVAPVEVEPKPKELIEEPIVEEPKL